MIFLKDARSLEEMRAEIFRIQQYDSMVRHVMDMANYRGMSAEDRFTVLAYYALRERALLQNTIIDAAMVRPATPIVFPPNEATGG